MLVGEEFDREAAHTIRYAVPRARVIELQGKLTRLQTAAASEGPNTATVGTPEATARWVQIESAPI